jgi:lipopolysaccharide/colanic/teichoic acid biosynthesis glycosyltransferase
LINTKTNNADPFAFQRSPLILGWRRFLKRGFDILFSFFGIIFLSPFFLPIAILLRREQRGPVFYRGLRVGRGGRNFQILKLRTMYECPESYNGARITARADGRITPLGRWLRDTKLNELPQLWNVLKGNMSFVGPRPEDPEIASTWPEQERTEILSMRPGLTSPASVLYRDEENLLPVDGVMEVYFRDVLPDKLRLDLLYVRNHSFFGDIDILFWTFMAIIPLLAHPSIPESRLFSGPFYRFMHHNISWFVLDLVVSFLAVGVAGVGWRMVEVIDWGVGPLSLLALILALLFSGVNVLLGLDRILWSRAGAEDGFVLALSNILTVLLLLLLNNFQEMYAWLLLPPLSTELILLIGLFTFVGGLFIRFRLRLVAAFANRWLSWRTERGGFGERVLILGAGESGQIVHWLLRRGNLRQLFNVIGMVDDDPAKQGMRIDGCWVLGGSRDLPALVRKYDVGVILFTITNISPSDRTQLLSLCKIPQARVIFLSDILETFQSQLIGRANPAPENP